MTDERRGRGGLDVGITDDETFVTDSGEGAPPRRSVSVRALLEDEQLSVELRLVAGEGGLGRTVDHTRIQKSGLALAGHFHGIVPSRIQILGETERGFLASLDDAQRRHALGGFFSLGLSCVILTGRPHSDPGPINELRRAADDSQTPLLVSSTRSSVTITALHVLLDERLAPRQRLHGVLIDVFGVGLFLMGPSGIGKSEVALDLVMRGHRLVADDAVECSYRPPDMVFGAPADLLRYHLEVRGLGILNIKDLFGVTAIRERKRVDLVAKLNEWTADTEYDRLGLEERFHPILGVRIPEVLIPVRPGRDVASILEVAARNELLKDSGHHSAQEFLGRLEGRLLPGAPSGSRNRVPESTANMPRVRGPSRSGGRS
jgi:HPr kinase/phosphorylase